MWYNCWHFLTYQRVISQYDCIVDSLGIFEKYWWLDSISSSRYQPPGDSTGVIYAYTKTSMQVVLCVPPPFLEWDLFSTDIINWKIIVISFATLILEISRKWSVQLKKENSEH